MPRASPPATEQLADVGEIDTAPELRDFVAQIVREAPAGFAAMRAGAPADDPSIGSFQAAPESLVATPDGLGIEWRRRLIEPVAENRLDDMRYVFDRPYMAMEGYCDTELVRRWMDTLGYRVRETLYANENDLIHDVIIDARACSDFDDLRRYQVSADAG